MKLCLPVLSSGRFRSGCQAALLLLFALPGTASGVEETALIRASDGSNYQIRFDRDKFNPATFSVRQSGVVVIPSEDVTAELYLAARTLAAFPPMLSPGTTKADIRAVIAERELNELLVEAAGLIGGIPIDSLIAIATSGASLSTTALNNAANAIVKASPTQTVIAASAAVAFQTVQFATNNVNAYNRIMARKSRGEAIDMDDIEDAVDAFIRVSEWEKRTVKLLDRFYITGLTRIDRIKAHIIGLIPVIGDVKFIHDAVTRDRVDLNALGGFIVNAQADIDYSTAAYVDNYFSEAKKTEIKNTLRNAGYVCAYSLSPASAARVRQGAGSVSVRLSARAGCSWTAESGNSGFLSVAPASGSGAATLTVTVRANSGAERIGVLTIAGHSFTVTQLAGTVVRNDQRLTVSKSGAGGGTVVSTPAGVSCGRDCTQDYVYGTRVTLSATPGSSSTFGGWSGACSGTGLCEVTMAQARSVTAVFGQRAAPTPAPTPDRPQQPSTLSVGSAVVAQNTDCASFPCPRGGGLLIRSGAGTSYSTRGALADGATGAIRGGPVMANGYAWWQVRWDSSAKVSCTVSPCTGWSVATFEGISVLAPYVGSVPDLIVEAPSVSDASLTPGQSFTLSATVRNRGTATSAVSTTLRYYRSSDASISSGDTQVGTDSVGVLSAGGTSPESINLSAPSSAGNYYYGACADGIAGETDTSNNCSFGVQATVGNTRTVRNPTGGTVNICGRTSAVLEQIQRRLRSVDNRYRDGSADCSSTRIRDLRAIPNLNVNNKGVVTLKQGDFDHLRDVDSLQLNYNQLSTLPNDIHFFEDLRNLRSLFLNNNRITALPVHIFVPLRSTLNRISLNNNQLITLPAGVFNGLSGLSKATSLNLRNNPLTTLPVGAFNGLSNLPWLILTDTRLTTLPVGVFNGLSSLENLSVGNQLRTLPAGVFDGLSSLTGLYLSDNQLTTLPAGVFSGLSSLTELDLEDNQLVTLPAGAFDGLSSLTSLYLHEQQLATIEAGAFDGLSSLALLRLDDNQLTTLPAGVFDGLSSLTGLSLYRNRLTTLPAGIFNGLSSLTELSLTSNPGAPFTLTLELARADGTDLNASGPAVITVRLAEGAPFAMTVGLSAEGGTLSASTATIAAGATVSTGVTVTQSGTGPVTVRLGTAPTVPNRFNGIQTAAGAPLILFGDDVYVSGVTLGAKGDGTVGWSARPSEYPGARIAHPTVSLDGAYYRVSELAYNPTAQQLKFAFGNAAPSATAALMLSFNPDLAFKDATRNGNVFTWNNVAATLRAGQRVALTLREVEPTSPTFSISGTPGAVEGAAGGHRFSVVGAGPAPSGSVRATCTVSGAAVTAGDFRDSSGATEASSDFPVQSLTFSAANYQTAQNCIIYTYDDTADESDEVFTVTLGVSGGGAVLGDATTTGTIENNDAPLPGVTVSPTTLTVTEGGSATYTLVLDTQPTAAVTISVAAAPGGDADLGADSASLTFSAADWNVAQTVTVSASEDADSASGTATFVHSAASADTNYGSALVIAGVTATEADNELTSAMQADVNGDGALDENDALIMYYAYSVQGLDDRFSGSLRGSLLRGLMSAGDRTDAKYVAALQQAATWRQMGASRGGDINGDGSMDEDDALIMYYAYSVQGLDDRLSRGLRSSLLRGLVPAEERGDAKYMDVLNRSNRMLSGGSR